jgi:hypothetical protein
MRRQQHNEIEKQKAYKNTTLPKDIDIKVSRGFPTRPTKTH